MKSGKLARFIAALLFAALAAVPLAAQEQSKEHVRYKLIDIGTLGGPNSSVSLETSPNQVLSDSGVVAGCAETPTPDPNYPSSSPFLPTDPLIQHAFRWKNGELSDLGALPGANSSCESYISGNGLIAGTSENDVVDPLMGSPEARAVLWKRGQIINLGTLGGNESLASGVNNRSQVIGASANAIPDPVSFFGFGTETRAFLWDNGVMQDLGTLGGPDAFAIVINDRGQVLGFSYVNSTPNSTTGIPTGDAFLWEDGAMTDIPDPLGGTVMNPFYLNNRGQVVGRADLPGDIGEQGHPFLWEKGVFTDLGTFGGLFGWAVWVNEGGQVVGWTTYPGDTIFRAFLWENGVKADLGTVDGDSCSKAYAINSRGQVVGWSAPCDESTHRAFLWENGGPMVDLNTLIPASSGIYLYAAININDRGEIAGDGVLPNGENRAFLLVPCDADDEGCVDGDETATTAVPRSSAPVLATTTLPQRPLTPRENIASWRAQMLRWHRSRVPGVRALKN